MGSRPFMTRCDLVLTLVLFSINQKQNSPLTFTTSNLCQIVTKCVELFMHYAYIDTGNFKTVAHKGDMISSQ